jgi:hypothetical protein
MASCPLWIWAFFKVSARAVPRVLITHSLSRIISDYSLANNFIRLFLVDSYFVRRFLDFSWPVKTPGSRVAVFIKIIKNQLLSETFKLSYIKRIGLLADLVNSQ